MTFSDASLTALRVFREVAERGTLTAAATALGYTQSAVLVMEVPITTWLRQERSRQLRCKDEHPR